MDERLTDLLAQLRERFAADATIDDVEAFLSSEGYDRRQIGEILALLFAELPVGTGAGEAQPVVHTANSIRVMGPHERGRFSPEAWGHILSLGSSGLVTPVELEHLVERAMSQIDGQIGLDDLRSLMESASADEGVVVYPDQITVH